MKQKELMYYGGVILIIAGVTMYVLSTVDLIPNKLGFWGYVDDAVVVFLGYMLYRRLRKNYKKRTKR